MEDAVPSQTATPGVMSPERRCGSVPPYQALLRHALQPVGRDVGERAPLLITGVDQGLIERPGHGDRDALWLSRMTGQCHWGAIQ